eukprot:m.132390 g.132390  ORF g.132390 m.132390 type:complete len:240 (-) comp11333_c0_seq2:1976-2695(-)
MDPGNKGGPASSKPSTSSSSGASAGKASSDPPGEERDALGRRVWNKAEFEARAKERARQEEEAASGSAKGAILAVKRENLKQREQKVDLTSRIGKSRTVESAHGAGSGYYCKVCDCVLRDSINYLDHINGKKHQRNLGMSMTVERSTVDQVKERLAAKKRQIEATKEGPKIYNLDARVAALQEEEEERLRQQKERKKRRKQEAKEEERRKQEERDAELGMGADPDMAALMGFGGFGSKS